MFREMQLYRKEEQCLNNAILEKIGFIDANAMPRFSIKVSFLGIVSPKCKHCECDRHETLLSKDLIPKT